MKWWSKCISVAIAITASRNVVFKVAKMREAIMEDQDEFLMRNSECTDVDVETNTRAQLEDVGQNADLYIANQGANSQPKAHTRWWVFISVLKIFVHSYNNALARCILCIIIIQGIAGNNKSELIK